MPQPRKFNTKPLLGLETGRNESYLGSVYLGLERGIWRAPTSFLNYFWGPLGAMAASLFIFIGAVLFLVFGFPCWLVGQAGVIAIGFTGRLRRQSLVRNNQSVVS